MPVLTTPLGVLLSLLLAAPSAPPSSDLAAEAPVPDWVPEGGSAAHQAGKDPREVNRKVRNAARTTIAGGGIAIVGLAAGIAGITMFMVSKQQLEKAKDDNGNYVAGDPKRQRAITSMQVAPYVGYAGAGLVVVGVITALIAGRRFKKLREDKRTSVAVGPMPMWRGGGLSAEVRF